MIRRALDILVAGLALALASPILALAAIAIKLASRGPVISRQRRVGRGGAGVRSSSSCGRWFRARSSSAPGSGSMRMIRESRASGRCSPYVARRAAEPVECPARRDVADRAAADRPEQVAVYTERQRGRLAIRRHHRLGAGRRARRPAWGQRSSSISNTSSTAHWHSTCGSWRARCRCSCTAAISIGGGQAAGICRRCRAMTRRGRVRARPRTARRERSG